jgi:hypothetical protein
LQATGVKLQRGADTEHRRSMTSEPGGPGPAHGPGDGAPTTFVGVAVGGGTPQRDACRTRCGSRGIAAEPVGSVRR